MSGAKDLPKPVSCTDVRQQWGVPSMKAHQDPEKEVMKRKPLQEIVFEKHVLSRDNAGGRKRKLPAEVNILYSFYFFIYLFINFARGEKKTK